MRSYIIGIILFLIWSSLSTWYYSEKIYNFNDEPVSLTELQEIDTIPSVEAVAEQPVLPPVPQSFTINFGFNEAVFTPDENLRNFTEDCKSYLMADTQSCLIITGHTDAIGSEEYNMRLGQRRAQSVKDYFLQMGLSEACIKSNSEGEAQPVSDNNTGEGRAKNRRATLSINQ